jgi:hypothetical protein
MINATAGTGISPNPTPTDPHEGFVPDLEDYDFPFDDDDEADSSVQSNVQRAHRTVPWGQGLEARRAWQYRHYDISRSKIFQFLQNGYGTVTRAILDDLIAAVLGSVPQGQRPKPPGRNQRRARNGLVMWLDSHALIVWQYLAWNCIRSMNGIIQPSCVIRWPPK